MSTLGGQRWRSGRLVAIVSAGICWTSTGLFGHWPADFAVSIPTARLIHNLERHIQLNPRDADAFFTLGRVHGLCFARDDKTIQVVRDKGTVGTTAPSLPPWESVTPGIDPLKEESEDMRVHMEQSIRNLRHSLVLNPRNYRAHLGLAWILEEGSRYAFRVGAPPSYENAQGSSVVIKKRIKGEDIEVTGSDLIDIALESDARKRDVWPDIRNHVDEMLPDLLSHRSNISAEQRVRLAGLIKFYWQKQALTEYRTAYAGTVQSEIGRQAGGPGANPFVSYEAGEAIIRILHRWYDSPEAKAEIAKITDVLRRIAAKPIAVTPIILSSGPRSSLVDLLEPSISVAFDLDGWCRDCRWPWVKSTTGILVWDPDRSGRVTSGRQLFGSVTWWMFWKSGYEALAALDDDGDGWLSGAELNGLAVWQDRNGNGVSEPGEVVPVSQLGIDRISVRSTATSGGVSFNKYGLVYRNGLVVPTYDWIAKPLPPVGVRRGR